MRQGVRIKLVLALALCAAVALLVACGSSSGGSSDSGSGPDPASLVPADAPLYGDFVVKPQGDQKDAVESFLEKITGSQDAGSTIVSKLDQSFAKDDITYEDDIEPWIGNDVGAFATKLGPSSTGAAVVPTSDPDAAMSTLETAAKNSPEDGKLTTATYKGIDYDVQGDSSWGPVGDFIVIGTDDAFKAAVDTSKGGPALADSSAYKSAVADVPDDALASGYADPKAIVQAIVDAGSVPASQANALLEQMGASGDGPVAGWLDATSSSAALTFSAPAPANAPSAGSSSLIANFPDDAWLAFGAANVGDGFTKGIQQLQSFSNSGLGGVDQGAMLRRFTTLTGIDIQNIGKWLGDVSGFMSGSSVLSLSGALVLGTKDESASQQTLSEVEKLFKKDADVITRPLGGGQVGFSVQPQTAPIQVVVEQRDGKVVIGLGQNSVDEALAPSSKLGDSDTYKAATGTLGGDLVPSLYFDFQPIASFLKLAEASSPDPGLEQAMPYLDRLDYLIAGASTTADRVESKIVLGVRSAPDSGTGVESSVLP
jgi:hypothetical protein